MFLMDVQCLIDKVNKCGRIVLYGNGQAAQSFYQWLKIKKLDYKLYGFMVTSKKDDYFMKKPIFEPGDKCLDDSELFVCVKKQFREEIIEVLREKGITKYTIVPEDFIAEILHLLPRKACKFEVHIVEHCNLNCRGCFHCSPLAKKEFLSVKDFERDIQRLSELYDGNLELMELLGGEPLLHPEITEFFRIARVYFPKGKVALVTNGILLLKMPENFWISAKKNNIELWPTYYPISVDYKAIQKKAESYEIKYNPFHITADENGRKLLENYHFDINGNEDACNNFIKCYRGNLCIFLRHGKLYSCVIGGNMHHFSEYFKLKNMVIDENNGIDIYSAENIEEISNFLVTPMQACKYCKLVDKPTLLPFQQSGKKMEEWL